jgi:cation transport ATPase
VTRLRVLALRYASTLPIVFLIGGMLLEHTVFSAPVMVLCAISVGWWLGTRAMADACAAEINRLREVEKSKARMVARARSKA